jgi:hypothetical protein
MLFDLYVSSVDIRSRTTPSEFLVLGSITTEMNVCLLDLETIRDLGSQLQDLYLTGTLSLPHLPLM